MNVRIRADLPGTRGPGPDDRARWVRFAELIRVQPEVLPYIRQRDSRLYDRLVSGLRVLAVEARSEEWRDPRPGIGGRAEQLIPGTAGSFSARTDWFVWLLMGGRGSGKSRTGAEATRELILGRRWKERPRWALIGQTLESVRVDMVERTLLEVLPPGSVRKWNRGPCELWLSNGAYLKGYSSEAPRKLRGPNFHGAWMDELGTWKDADRSPKVIDTTFSNAVGAVRADDQKSWKPRIVATTTPRSVPLLRNPDEQDADNPGPGLHDARSTVVSAMSTLDNLENLAESYLEDVVRPLEGTRLYDQEILGKLVDEVVGAQWSSELVQRMIYPPGWAEGQGGGLQRVVIGVDPSVGAGRGDECGIVVAGLAYDGRAYVLEDLSKRCPAREWVEIIADAYRRWGAVAVVVEVNNGGELVEETLGRYAPNLPIVEVWAKRNKEVRAEPIALLSDRDKVRFQGPAFSKLWLQMRTWAGSGPSPDRLDAFVYAVMYLLPVGAGMSELVSVRRGRGRR